MKILITGSAGFIGFHTAQEFLRRGWEVVGLDNFCDYYSVQLKHDRETQLAEAWRTAAAKDSPARYAFREIDICDLEKLKAAFAETAPDVVLNLAAQPGVR